MCGLLILKSLLEKDLKLFQIVDHNEISAELGNLFHDVERFLVDLVL